MLSFRHRKVHDFLLDEFETELTSVCSKYEYVCLAGDANARTSKLPDVIPSDHILNDIFDIDQESQAYFDKFTMLENLNIPLVTCRYSQDKKTNAHGMRFIETCRNNNLFIMNGQYDVDVNVCKLTFRNKSLIDYVIVTAENVSGCKFL